MVIARQFIQTPYMKYSVQLDSVAVRKLTIMEWTILRIANDYSINPKYKSYRLSQFFEDILGMDRSELLIRPCINSLLRLKLIEIEGYTSFALAADTVVGKIHLTKEGLDALQHNYIPGESKKTEECIFYDLLSGLPKEYLLDQSLYDSDHTAIKITSKTSFDVQFPADEIITSINKGALFFSKYKNNNSVAQEVECTDDELVWSTGLLMLDQGDDGTYSCNYPLTNDIYTQLVKMTGSPIKSVSGWTSWPSQLELPAEMLNARFALRDIESYISYSEYVFVSASVWPEFSKKFKKNLKAKTCIVFGAEHYRIEPGDITVVFVPFSPDDGRIIVMVPGNEVICAAQKSCFIEERKLDMWFSYRQNIIQSAEDWFASEVSKLVMGQPGMAALLFLPIMNIKEQETTKILKSMLQSMDSFSDKISLLKLLNNTCGELRIGLPDYDMLIEDLAGDINYQSSDAVAEDLLNAYDSVFVDYDEYLFAELIVDAAERYGFDRGILDVHKILSCVFQGPHTDMVGFMELAEERVFSKMSAEHLDDLFGSFSDCIPETMPEMSLVSSAYNALRKNLKLVSGLLKDMDWYNEINRDELLNAMINCSVLPKVQETVGAIRETITELQERGCTVFSADGVCYGFTEHLDMLEQMLSCFVYPNGEMATVYLIDTCVFLHSPDILSYFREDELIRIPFTVLRELDYHKDNNSDYSLKKNAAYACKQIEKKTEEAKLRGDDHFGVEPRDYPEMLPDGFSKHKHDDLILSAALRYKLLDPRILTDDTNFRNIARTQGIDPIAWDKFVTDRGGVAIRGQAKTIANTAVAESEDKQIIVEPTPEFSPPPVEEDNETASQSQTAMTAEKLYGMPLLYAVKKFGLNSKELSLLLSHKLKTCGDLAKADEMEIKGFYKKKKAFMANHLLEVRKKINAEADRLTTLTENTIE